MSTQRKVLIESQASPIAQTTLYTSTLVETTIDRMTATNTDAAAQTISVNLVPPAGAPLAANLFTKTVSIAASQSYQFPEIVGHDLAPGGMISVIASSVNITLRASGRVTTQN